jgi:hypothetical protein
MLNTCWLERIIQVRIRTFRGVSTVIGVYASFEGKENDNKEF